MISRVLLILALLTGGAFAQGPILPGPGLPVAAAGPPTFTYRDIGAGTSGSGVLTSPSLSIGAASASRRVYMFIRTQNIFQTIVSAEMTPSGGSSIPCDVAVFAYDEGGGNFQSLLYISAEVPTATTAVATVTFNGGSVFGSSWAVYTVDKTTLISKTAVTAGTKASALTITNSVAVLSGGAIVTWGGIFDISPQNVPSFTSPNTSSVVFDADSNGTGTLTVGHVNSASANASSQFSMTATGTLGGSGSIYLAQAAFR